MGVGLCFGDHGTDQGSALGSDCEVSGKREVVRINSKRFLDSETFCPREHTGGSREVLHLA